MLLIICLVNIFFMISLITGGVYVYSKAKSAVNEVSQTLSDYFTVDTPEGISPFGQLLNQFAEIQAQRLGVTVQAAIRGSVGGKMKAIVPALEAEAAAEYPELGLAELLPKSLKKSPAAQVGLQLLLNKIMANKSGSRNNHRESAANTTQHSFNL